PVPTECLGSQDQGEHSRQADQYCEVSQEGNRQGNCDQSSQEGESKENSPGHHPGPNFHRPTPDNLAGKVEAEQRYEESMAVVIISRPGVVEMPEIIPKQNAEQGQTDKPSDHCHALGRIADRLGKENQQSQTWPRRGNRPCGGWAGIVVGHRHGCSSFQSAREFLSLVDFSWPWSRWVGAGQEVRMRAAVRVPSG